MHTIGKIHRNMLPRAGEEVRHHESQSGTNWDHFTHKCNEFGLCKKTFPGIFRTELGRLMLLAPLTPMTNDEFPPNVNDAC